MNKTTALWLHLSGITAILLLSSYAWRLRQQTLHSEQTLHEAESTCTMALPAIKEQSQCIFDQLSLYAADYPNPKMTEAFQRATAIVLENTQDETPNSDNTTLSTSPARARVEAALKEQSLLLEIGSEMTFCGAYESYQPLLIMSLLNPSVGDTVTMECILSGPLKSKRHITYQLNGVTLPQTLLDVPFSVQYERPGLYPLHFSAKKEVAGSPPQLLCEQTCYLRVTK